ncbi:MAG TPA: hypothetical protein VH592_01530 [Gemmataceae bacterium]|jgi:hypothetical protein
MWRTTPVASVILFLLEVASCLRVDSILTASRGCAAEEFPKKSIENLIADLGSDRLEIRDAATRALLVREEAIPALRKALPKARLSEDLDLRRRVEGILQALERFRALDALTKTKELGKAGRAVEVADRLAMAAKSEVNADEGWESLAQLAAQAIAPTDRYFPYISTPAWQQQLPVGEFRRYRERFNPHEVAKSKIDLDAGTAMPTDDPKKRAADDLIHQNRGRLLLRGEQVTLTGVFALLRNGMIAASGDVHVSKAMYSVIVVGGGVKNVNRMTDCILICDGDVELLDGWQLSGSIIVARGKVTCKNGEIKDCLVRTGRTLLLPNGVKIDLKDGTPDPLAFVKFFELNDVGIAAEDLPPRAKSDVEGVRLKEVRKESLFSAGLRADDVITAIEEKKTPTTEIFRRVLRRKLAEGGPILTFTVRRAGKTLDVPLPVKD